jgi:hypothetical protein
LLAVAWVSAVAHSGGAETPPAAAHTEKTSIPSTAPNCSIKEPPQSAGAYATPGGFLLVHPRNAELRDDYTGCKSLWVVDAPDRFNRLMTLYFEGGKLRVVVAYDGRGESDAPRATCTLPAGGPACEGVEGNELAALRLATWPRSCMSDPDAAVCAKDPD